jgi:hypothetical protein
VCVFAFIDLCFSKKLSFPDKTRQIMINEQLCKPSWEEDQAQQHPPVKLIPFLLAISLLVNEVLQKCVSVMVF